MQRQMLSFDFTVESCGETFANITSTLAFENLQSRENDQNQIYDLTQRIYSKCSTCDKVLDKAKMQQTRDEVEMRFRNVYSYFAHDIDEINRLEEEAMLILRKKNLGFQELNEEEYMGRL